MSVAGGFDKAIDRALSVGCTAMQVFVKNNMQWFAKPLGAPEIAAFHDHPRRPALRSVFGHAGYLINLAAANPENLERSRESLAEELKRADQLEIPFLVIHPGAHTGAGVEAGLRRAIESIDGIYGRNPGIRCRLALEVTAGQGTCLGHELEHLAAIIGGAREPERLATCIDTAHLLEAGFDIASPEGFESVIDRLESLAGPGRLAALHLNDSKTPLGSRVDRHAHLGKGHIGGETFRHIIRSERYRAVPKVLETPKGPDLKEDAENLGLLRRFASEPAAPRGASVVRPHIK
jgi:deoxyribonuclease-4